MRIEKGKRIKLLKRMHVLLSKGWASGQWKRSTYSMSGNMLNDGSPYGWTFCIQGAAEQAYIEEFGGEFSNSHAEEVCEALSIRALALAKTGGEKNEQYINDDRRVRIKAGLPSKGKEAVLQLVEEKLKDEGVEL